jgi:hypothetical protein
MEQETIQLGDIPKELFDPVWRSISTYLVGLVKIRKTDSFDEIVLCGSGTLVEINGRYAILTAHHVIGVLPRAGEIGVILTPQQANRFTLEAQTLTPVKIARGENDFEGPDLGLLLLPTAKIGQIKAIQSFYNLSPRREQMLNDPPEIHSGVWLLGGYPNELTTNELPEGNFARVQALRHYVMEEE